MLRAPGRMTAATLLLVMLMAGRSAAQPRTDIVVLANGDRITGEVVRLERGRLEFKTDEMGTLYIEWDTVSRLQSVRNFEVGTSDGRRFLGSLAGATDRSLSIGAPDETVSIPLADVTFVTAIGRSFWRKLDGSVDVGFSYTQSSGIAQLNVNSDTVYRRPRFEGRVTLSLTGTRQDQDDERDDRGALEVSYMRYRWTRWFVGASSRFEANESLGLRLRSQVGAVVGPRLVNSNRAQLGLGAGLVVNDERGVDAESTRNVEALVTFQTSYFTYDRPSTDIAMSFVYYPSLSNTGRHRLQLDARAKREFWKDLFLALNLYDSFDNRPPNPAFDTNDIGIVLSVGWSY